MPEETVGFIQLVSEELRNVKAALDKQDGKIEGVDRKIELVKDALTDLRIGARDVTALQERTDLAYKGTEATRRELADLEKEVAVYKAATNSVVAVNETNIRDLTERLKWLSRLVIGALLTGVIGGAIAWLFKSLG